MRSQKIIYAPNLEEESSLTFVSCGACESSHASNYWHWVVKLLSPEFFTRGCFWSLRISHELRESVPRNFTKHTLTKKDKQQGEKKEKKKNQTPTIELVISTHCLSRESAR